MLHWDACHKHIYSNNSNITSVFYWSTATGNRKFSLNASPAQITLHLTPKLMNNMICKWIGSSFTNNTPFVAVVLVNLRKVFHGARWIVIYYIGILASRFELITIFFCNVNFPPIKITIDIYIAINIIIIIIYYNCFLYK